MCVLKISGYFVVKMSVIFYVSACSLWVVADDVTHHSHQLNLAQKIDTSIQVYDYLGRTVKVAQPVKRVVALAPHIVENFFSAGAGHTLVGAVDYSDYPEVAKGIPRVGGFSSLSLEVILSLKPDLVVVWQSGHGARVMDKLLAMGLVVYVSDPRVLGDVSKSIADFGRLAGTFELAQNEVQAYNGKLVQLQRRYGNKSPVRTFYQVWNNPIQTLNDKSLISDVIRLCSGVNVFGDELSLAPKVSIESVISVNPQAIVTSGMGVERPEWLDAWKKWKPIEAVKQGNLFFVPPDLIQRHTARLLSGAQMLCEHLDQARGKP